MKQPLSKTNRTAPFPKNKSSTPFFQINRASMFLQINETTIPKNEQKISISSSNMEQPHPEKRVQNPDFFKQIWNSRIPKNEQKITRFSKFTKINPPKHQQFVKSPQIIFTHKNTHFACNLRTRVL